MCGIAGVLYEDPSRLPDRGVLAAMGGQLAHRGPDAQGFWVAPGVGLVHRRLSIIDLGGGGQPIGNEDHSVQVVFNGEIYNYRALRSGLRERGHHLRTESDTEVLVHLYEDMGERLVERLRGMFAFALWDRPRGQLLLARDRLGIKPLYVYRDGEKLLFGSELKAILAHPDVARSLDVTALEDYLTFGVVPGAKSIFSRVEKLPPAHVLLARPGSLGGAPCRYWRLRFEPDHRLTEGDWVESIRAKVDETVKLHLIADVPVGAFLSGGLDSSAVVATAAGLVDGPLRTFSVGFHEESFNELPYARGVAARFGTRHSEAVLVPDAVELLGELAHYYDEPFADPSALPTFLVCREASRSVKVALSGDGGDEAFGGYSRYVHDLREAAVRRRLPAWLRRSVLRPVASAWPRADWLPRRLRAKTLLTNLAMAPGPAYANTLSLCRLPLRRQILSPDLASGLNGYRPEYDVEGAFEVASGDDELRGMIAADVTFLLPDDFLVKVDRASMAHGLEVRPPLLDHELMELAARIPSDRKVRGGEGKWIFKQAYRDRLPAGTADRPKRGFEVPVDAWLRGPLREAFESAVLDPGARADGLIDRAAVRKLFRSHLAGTGRHGTTLWALLVLARWAERYLSHSRPPAAPSREGLSGVTAPGAVRGHSEEQR
jgi:asparagine synthase (glutamine-hydrolysing)